jgi:hypothetical protein
MDFLDETKSFWARSPFLPLLMQSLAGAKALLFLGTYATTKVVP